MTYKNKGPPREEIVALGSGAYDNAITSMMGEIGDLVRYIAAWNDIITGLGEPIDGEDSDITKRRDDYLRLVERARKRINKVNALHDEVTKHRTTLQQRVIGFVLHSERIEVSVEPHGYTKDWALIELYETMIDWPSFKGNKVYVGKSFSISLFPSFLPPLVLFISRHVFQLLYSCLQP
jgi:hypothetical protein